MVRCTYRRWGGKVKNSTPKVEKKDGKKKPTGRAKKRKLFNKRIVGNHENTNKQINKFYGTFHALDRKKKDQETILVTSSITYIKNNQRTHEQSSAPFLISTKRLTLCTKKMFVNRKKGRFSYYHYYRGNKIKKFELNEKAVKSDQKAHTTNKIQFIATGIWKEV